MDLAKALTLNGEKVLDKPVKITKAKVKSEDKEKVKAPPLDKKGKKYTNFAILIAQYSNLMLNVTRYRFKRRQR